MNNELLSYFNACVLGTEAGSYLTLIYPSSNTLLASSRPTLMFYSTNIQAFAVEFVLTAVLILAIMVLSNNSNGAPKRLAPALPIRLCSLLSVSPLVC